MGEQPLEQANNGNSSVAGSIRKKIGKGSLAHVPMTAEELKLNKDILREISKKKQERMSQQQQLSEKPSSYGYRN